MRRLSRCLVLVALVLAVPAPSGGAPPARVIREAQARFERANRLYHEGRYAEALLLYQAAYDLLPSPDFLFNLALAREKTLDYEGCAQGLVRYLREPQGAEDRQRAEARLEHCRARTLIPVKVSSMPLGAAVFVGEGPGRSPRGRTPARLDLAPGTYVVSAELPGHQGQRQKVTAEIGTRPEVDFTLEKLSSLRVEADVPGAEVQLNDGFAEAAPFQQTLPAGTYRVRVERAGFRAIVRQVRIESGQQVSLMISLATAPRALTLHSNAPALVRLDGKLVGHTPLAGEAAPGLHRLEVTAPGRVPLLTELQVTGEGDLNLVARLRPARSRASKVLTVVLLGLTTASATSAVVFGSLALANERDYRTGVPTRRLADEGRRNAHVADALWISTGVLVLAAGAYWLFSRPGASRLVKER